MINSFQSYHFSIAKNIKWILKTIFKYIVNNVFMVTKRLLRIFNNSFIMYLISLNFKIIFIYVISFMGGHHEQYPFIESKRFGFLY